MGGNTEATMMLILVIFGIAHSGLAGLRPKGEAIIGERAYRVLFGLVSLPLAILALVYFINHRYDGTLLWDIKGVPGGLFLRPARCFECVALCWLALFHAASCRGVLRCVVWCYAVLLCSAVLWVPCYDAMRCVACRVVRCRPTWCCVALHCDSWHRVVSCRVWSCCVVLYCAILVCRALCCGSIALRCIVSCRVFWYHVVSFPVVCCHTE